MSRTLYQKIVDEHTIKRIDAQTVLLYCDVHFANEYTSPQAFAGLSSRKLPAAVPDAHLCVVDHIIPSTDESPGESRITTVLCRRKRLKPTAANSASVRSTVQMTRIRASNML